MTRLEIPRGQLYASKEDYFMTNRIFFLSMLCLVSCADVLLGEKEFDVDASEDALEPSVRWLSEGGSMGTLSDDEGIMLALSYELQNTAKEHITTFRQCWLLQNTLQRCSMSALEGASTGTNAIRWEVHPGNYGIGSNEYTFELFLHEGDTLLSTDAYSLTLEVTDCQRCVNADGARLSGSYK